MVSDTGFEPVTSSVCKGHKFWAQYHGVEFENTMDSFKRKKI